MPSEREEGLVVSHNHPIHIEARVVGQAGVITLRYINQLNPAENGVRDKNVETIDRFMLFDEDGFHHLIFVAVREPTENDAHLDVVLTDSVDGAEVFPDGKALETPFDGAIAALHLRVLSF